jgi:hypothetical protein
LVSITALVTANESPVANASITFTITKSNGNVISGTATTGADGTAVYKFRLKRADRLATCQVAVTASLGGVSGSASTSFTVH